MKEFSKKEIMDLIRKGFDLELIAFELEIPLEEINEIKNEMVQTIGETKREKKYSPSKNSRMDKLRLKYKELYEAPNAGTLSEAKRELVQSEIAIIELTISNIESLLENLKNNPEFLRNNVVKDILVEIRSIEGLPMRVEQFERINKLLKDNALASVVKDASDKKVSEFNRAKLRFARELAKTVDYEASQATTLTRILELDKKITYDMVASDQATIGGVKHRIGNRIASMRQKEAAENIVNNVSPDVKKIILNLAKGELNLEEAKKVIEQEVGKRLEKKNRTTSQENIENEKRQIFIQIRNVLMEKAKEYPLEKPETTVIQIYELEGKKDISTAIRAVIKNLIASKKFDKAREICDEFRVKDKSSPIYKFLESMRNQIQSEEIGDFILRAIASNGTYEEEEKFLNLIEKGLRTKSLNLRSISLGKSKDKLRQISLADIWTDEKEQDFYGIF